jgi:hypothetical protein
MESWGVVGRTRDYQGRAVGGQIRGEPITLSRRCARDHHHAGELGMLGLDELVEPRQERSSGSEVEEETLGHF